MAQAGQHRSVAELELSIQDWIDTWNQNPRPFVWTKTADEILDTIAHYCQRIRDTSPHRLRRLLHQWRDAVPREDRTADLSPNSTTCWPSSPSAPGTCATRWPSNRLGTLPRFNALLADYESVRRRARPDAATPG